MLRLKSQRKLVGAVDTFWVFTAPLLFVSYPCHTGADKVFYFSNRNYYALLHFNGAVYWRRFLDGDCCPWSTYFQASSRTSAKEAEENDGTTRYTSKITVLGDFCLKGMRGMKTLFLSSLPLVCVVRFSRIKDNAWSLVSIDYILEKAELSVARFFHVGCRIADVRKFLMVIWPDHYLRNVEHIVTTTERDLSPLGAADLGLGNTRMQSCFSSGADLFLSLAGTGRYFLPVPTLYSLFIRDSENLIIQF